MGHPFSAEAQLNSIKEVLTESPIRSILMSRSNFGTGAACHLGSKADENTQSASPTRCDWFLVRPSIARNIVRLYATGQIEFEGGDLIEFSEALRTKRSNRERLT